jgi:hypothetical protein
LTADRTVPSEALARLERVLAPIVPTFAQVIAGDRSEAGWQRLAAARQVNQDLPFDFAIEGLFFHPEGAQVPGRGRPRTAS